MQKREQLELALKKAELDTKLKAETEAKWKAVIKTQEYLIKQDKCLNMSKKICQDHEKAESKSKCANYVLTAARTRLSTKVSWTEGFPDLHHW